MMAEAVILILLTRSPNGGIANTSQARFENRAAAETAGKIAQEAAGKRTKCEIPAGGGSCWLGYWLDYKIVPAH